MAHFRATIKGNRGEASRLGSRAGGMRVTCNGWNGGVTVEAVHTTDGEDVFAVYATDGSNGGHSRQIALVRNAETVKLRMGD